MRTEIMKILYNLKTIDFYLTVGENIESTVLSSNASLAIRQRFFNIFTDKTGKGYKKSLRLYPYTEDLRCTEYIWEFLSPAP